jgi:hypothetical protein
MATDWTTEGLEFEDFFILNVVQTGFGAHPTSSAMGSGDKAAGE